MPEHIDTTGMMLGEIKGQMRELIHNSNNMAQKLDALTERVIGAKDLPEKLEKLEARVTALETDKNKRDGAMGFGGWLLHSPLLAWLATGAVALWALLKGKL